MFAVGILITPLGDAPVDGPAEAVTSSTAENSGPPVLNSGSALEEPDPNVLAVPVLGASLQVPPGGWDRTGGPDARNWLFSDGDVFELDTVDDEWISFLGAGVYGLEPFSDPDYSSMDGRIPIDNDDLEASADAAMRVWTSEAIASPTGVELSTIRHRDVVVSGFDAVLAEARITWEHSEVTEDTFEDTAILVLDVNGIDGFIGIASVTESDADLYDETVASLLETVIDLQSVNW